MSQNLPSVPAAQRITLCYGIDPDATQGPSLREIDSEGLPDGALAFVVSKNTLYRLKKSSVLAPDTTTSFHNIVAASGGGNWVRNVQMAQVSLSGGTGTIVSKFDLTGTAQLVASVVTLGGTAGISQAVLTNATTVTVTSSSNSDTSVVLVQVIQTSYP